MARKSQAFMEIRRYIFHKMSMSHYFIQNVVYNLYQE